MKKFLKRYKLPLIAFAVVVVSLLALYFLTGSTETAAIWMLGTIVAILALIVIAGLLAAAYLHLLPDKKHLERMRSKQPDSDNSSQPAPPSRQVIVQRIEVPATSKKRGGWLRLDAIIIALFVIWVGWETLTFFKFLPPMSLVAMVWGHQPHFGSSQAHTPAQAPGQPHLPSGAPVQACTEPPRVVTVTKDDVTWVDVPPHCTLHLDTVTDPTKVFDLSCVDTDDTLHDPWIGDDCKYAKSDGLKLKGDLPEDSQDFPISFT